jgi:hypothetical protein
LCFLIKVGLWLFYPEIWHRVSDLGPLAKGVATGAGAAGIGVIDGETLLLNAVLEVNGGSIEVRDAHGVNHDLYPVKIDYSIVFFQGLIEEQLVDQARAASRLHGNSET